MCRIDTHVLMCLVLTVSNDLFPVFRKKSSILSRLPLQRGESNTFVNLLHVVTSVFDMSLSISEINLRLPNEKRVTCLETMVIIVRHS